MVPASIEDIGEDHDGAARLLEARLVWGGEPILVRHVRVRARVTIGELGAGLGSDDLVIAREEDGVVVLCLPSGAAVPAGCRMTLRMGRAQLRLTLMADDAVVLPRARTDRRVALGIIGAAALHLVVLGLVAHGRADEGAQGQGALVTMQRMLASAEERALEETAAAQERSDQDLPAAAAPGPASAPLARTGPPDPGGTPAAHTGHEEAATFGLLGLLARDGKRPQTARSAFAEGPSSPALGTLFGETIHEATATGGLGLSGAGEGGGGLGAGVPLSSAGYATALTRTSP